MAACQPNERLASTTPQMPTTRDATLMDPHRIVFGCERSVSGGGATARTLPERHRNLAEAQHPGGGERRPLDDLAGLVPAAAGDRLRVPPQRLLLVLLPGEHLLRDPATSAT